MEEVKKIFVVDLPIDDESKKILLDANFKVITDFSGIRIEEVENLLARAKYGVNALGQIKNIMHRDCKITFQGEYDHLGLTPDAANISLSQLNLPTIIKNSLNTYLKVYTLGELLTTDYSKIVQTRNLGEKSISVLRDYVHDLGFSLHNEKPSVKETLAKLKEQGTEVLGDKINNHDLCTLLYRNNIYTIADLLKYGDKVYKISGMGTMRRQQLQDFLIANSLELSPVENKNAEDLDVPAIITEEMIKNLRANNDNIKKMVEEKEVLVAQYKALLEENKELHARNAELDLELSSLEKVKEGTTIGKKY